MFARHGKAVALADAVAQSPFSVIITDAEGTIETAEQHAALRASGCDLAQGWYFSKALPPGKFVDFLQRPQKRRCSPLLSPEFYAPPRPPRPPRAADQATGSARNLRTSALVSAAK